MTALADRLQSARDRVAAAARRAGRDPSDIRVVVVTKRHPVSALARVVDAGATDLGENFVQELVAKQSALSEAPIQWHFIGRLQRNKVKGVVGRVALIHAVDSARLVEAIARRAETISTVQRILIAVNLSSEPHKTGVAPDDVEALLTQVTGLRSVRCDGLMTMPPLVQDAELNRVHFRALAQLRDRLARDSCKLSVLSMGTSCDFEVAVEEGATLVRLGTVILGGRPPTAV